MDDILKQAHRVSRVVSVGDSEGGIIIKGAKTAKSLQKMSSTGLRWLTSMQLDGSKLTAAQQKQFEQEAPRNVWKRLHVANEILKKRLRLTRAFGFM